MIIPNKIKVLGHEYVIMWVTKEDLPDETGELDPTTLTLKIRKDIPQSQQEETLIHEIIHAIDSELSEEQTYLLSMAFYAVLKENKLISQGV